jgi:hypothetical protein
MVITCATIIPKLSSVELVKFALTSSGLVAVAESPFAEQPLPVLTSDFPPSLYVRNFASTYTGQIC